MAYEAEGAGAAAQAEAAEDDDDLGDFAAIEIDFLEPSSGRPTKKLVFGNKQEWRGKWHSKFIISSSLINMLNEAVVTRTNLFKECVRILNNCRSGYLAALYKARQLAESTVTKIPSEDMSHIGNIRNSEGEFMPVHFYYAEMYWDSFTEEAYDMGLKKMQKDIKKEIKNNIAEINKLGGQGGSFALMKKLVELEPSEDIGKVSFMLFDNWNRPVEDWNKFGPVGAGKGVGRSASKDPIPPPAAAAAGGGGGVGGAAGGAVVAGAGGGGGEGKKNEVAENPGGIALVPDPDGQVRRGIDEKSHKQICDKYLPGTWDEYVVLEPKVKALEEVLDDRNQRVQKVEKSIEEMKMQIPDQNKCIVELKEILAKVYVPPEVTRRPPKVETQAEKDARRDAVFEWKRKERELFQSLLDEVQGKVAEWEAEAAKISHKYLKELETQAKEEEMKCLVGKKRLENIERKRKKEQAKEEEALRQLAEVQKQHEELQRQLAAAGMPDPLTLRLTKMKRWLRELIKDSKKIREELAIPIQKVKAMRYALKILYKKLGWEWDFSDSEDEGEKPYWKRRLLAQDAILKFDPHVFLNEEKDFQKRRMEKRKKQIKSMKDAEIEQQIAAKRWLDGSMSMCETSAGPTLGLSAGPTIDHMDSLWGGESSIMPFKGEDPVETALRRTMQHLIIEREELELPKWVHDAAALEARCRRAVQLQGLRGSLEAQLRQCAACFLDQLPHEGLLGDLRVSMAEALETLHAIPVDSSTWEDGEQEKELVAACQEVHSFMDSAISLSPEVGTISLALQHSVEFTELWYRLTEVRNAQYDMRADVKAIAGKGFIFRQNSRIMSVNRNDYGEESIGSLRGPMTPGPSQKPTSAYSSPRLRSLSPTGSLMGSLRGMDVFSEPFMGAAGSGMGFRQRRREATGEVVDFGFRPDGGGEESLENWSLFKVSRGHPMPQDLGGSSSASGRGTSARTSRKSDRRLSDKKVQRYQKLATSGDCDFREYMAQQQQKAMYASASDSQLRDTTPKLPELVDKPYRPTNPFASTEGRRGGAYPSLTRDRSAAAIRAGLGKSSRW